MLNAEETTKFVNARWDDSILPSLEEYITIPALSPHFDVDWQTNGHIERAVEHVRAWCADHPVAGMKMDVVRLEGRTPLLFIEIPASNGGSDDRTVLLYGHCDKQPEMHGWDEDKGPWKPVRIGDKLYGRGGADDGYSAYASLTAIEALQRQGIAHDRCVVMIEACEESGSFDLPHYLDHLEDRVGQPYLVVCLDSGCGNYDQLWTTTSLRGLVGGVLEIEVMQPTSDGQASGVHSGDATGIVPSSFRVLRQLLGRVEDPDTGTIRLEALHTTIPDPIKKQAAAAAAILGDEVYTKFPFSDGVSAAASGADAVLARTWKPGLEVVGLGDVADLSGGNVLRGRIRAKLSLRIPPRVDAQVATNALKAALETDAPYGARVRFEPEQGADGWAAPPLAPWLDKSLQAASQKYFGKDAAFMGEGGTIPFMGMLGQKYPKAQFVITGLLGPASNAHGPNEFLHIPCGKNVTACMTAVLADGVNAPLD